MKRRKGITVKDAGRVQKRRAALVRAAIKVFSGKGFNSSTVNEVARVAGVSQGTVYNYVDNKADLLYLVCSHVYGVYERHIEQALLGATDALEKLYLALDATIDATFELQDHLLLLYQEVHCLDRKQRKPFLRDAARLRALYENILADAAAATGLDFGHRRVVASMVLMLPSALIMRRWDLRGRVAESTMRNEAVRFLLKGLGLPSDRLRFGVDRRGASATSGSRRRGVSGRARERVS
ncbi:MAG: TetR/AcrR family transcriptional regulator [Alphaproteobacteria bacterium]|nr:TetR/AcrR family transcriptional regulator [Alphaproteobacteria bacterium]